MRTCHDVADGGLLVAVAEMALAGGLGATLRRRPTASPLHAWLFGEDQGRYVLAVPDAAVAAIEDEAAARRRPGAGASAPPAAIG